MLIQKQLNNWSCLPTAFAIILNKPATKIIEAIGHDGSEILWPELGEPECRKGFHIQECIKTALYHGWGVIHLDINPIVIKNEFNEYSYGDDTTFILGMLLSYSGVLLGKSFAKSHAVAWDYETQLCLDPKTGESYNKEHFHIETFLMFRSLFY